MGVLMPTVLPLSTFLTCFTAERGKSAIHFFIITPLRGEGGTTRLCISLSQRICHK